MTLYYARTVTIIININQLSYTIYSRSVTNSIYRARGDIFPHEN